MHPINGLWAFKDIPLRISVVPVSIVVKVLTFYKSSRIFIIELTRSFISIVVLFTDYSTIRINKSSLGLDTAIRIKVDLNPIDGLFALENFTLSIDVVPIIINLDIAICSQIYSSTRIFVVEVAVITKDTFGLFTIIRVKVYRNIVNGLRTFKPFTVIAYVVPVFVDLDITIDYESTSSTVIIFFVTCEISLNLSASFFVKEVFNVVDDGRSFNSLTICSNEVGLVINGNETISN